MTYINPLANALPQSFATQNEQSAVKTRQARTSAPVPRAPNTETDQFEHQLEGSKEAAPIHEEARKKRQPREPRQRHNEDESAEEGTEPDHIDLTA